MATWGPPSPQLRTFVQAVLNLIVNLGSNYVSQHLTVIVLFLVVKLSGCGAFIILSQHAWFWAGNMIRFWKLFHLPGDAPQKLPGLPALHHHDSLRQSQPVKRVDFQCGLPSRGKFSSVPLRSEYSFFSGLCCRCFSLKSNELDINASGQNGLRWQYCAR